MGVSNSQTQFACAEGPADGFYMHEGVLYHSLTFELAKDALVNGGPGLLARIDMAKTCALPVAEGLDVEDVLDTDTAIII